MLECGKEGSGCEEGFGRGGLGSGPYGEEVLWLEGIVPGTCCTALFSLVLCFCVSWPAVADLLRKPGNPPDERGGGDKYKSTSREFVAHTCTSYHAA